MAADGKNIERVAELRSVNFTLEYGVEANQLIYIKGILGITNASGASGATNHVVEIKPRLIQLELPGAVYDAAVQGTKLYIVVANVTGYTLDTDAITATASTNLFLGYVVRKFDDVNHYAEVAFCPEYS